MGKLLLTIIMAAAVILGIITFTNQSKSQPSFANIFDTPTPSPLAMRVDQQSNGSLPGEANPTSAAVSPVGPQEVKPTDDPLATVSAIIKTSKGDITLTLYKGGAPNTVANFISKAKSGFYNGLDFHRVEDWVIQGGDPNGNGTGGKNVDVERNEYPFVRGSIGMAGSTLANGSTVANDAQFFILKKDASWLNRQYSNFGMVTAGLDVVDKIQIGDKILSIQIVNN